MSARLVVIAGPNEGQVFPLAHDTKVNLGRGEAAQVRLTDPSVSRIHCAIDYFGGQAVLTDCASKTGVRVNGKPATRHELRPSEVIGIGHTQLRFQVEAPPPAAKPEQKPARHPEELRRLSNTHLSHFEIGDVVAVGNSGVVFRAHDSKEEREVALKVYLPQFAESEEDLQRFIRAVKTMLPLRHPNLVTLLGGGKTGAYCWMSMEFVEGHSLTETIARIGKGGKLDWRPALRVALDIGRGLFYLHDAQIIHRSLTPDNILHSKLGVAKLGSLILAKALSGALAKDVTTGGELLGDVRYLAPEQAGGGGAVDGRADIYSLGTLVYALLTGKPPFEGKSPLQTATWILKREPTPPREVDPHIPKPLERTVLRMLAKRPEERYQSAGELLAELEQLPKS